MCESVCACVHSRVRKCVGDCTDFLHTLYTVYTQTHNACIVQSTDNCMSVCLCVSVCVCGREGVVGRPGARICECVCACVHSRVCKCV